MQAILGTLDRDSPLPPHVAQPLVKILKGLITHEGGPLTEFMWERAVPDFLRHLETHEMGSVVTALLGVRNTADELWFARSALCVGASVCAWPVVAGVPPLHGESGQCAGDLVQVQFIP